MNLILPRTTLASRLVALTKRGRRKLPDRGMTLMEVVIALGMIGFILPIILAATTSTGNSRRNAEAETRASWIVRHIQQEIHAKWSDPPLQSLIDSDFAFPLGAGEESTAVMIFDREGRFLRMGSNQDLTTRIASQQAFFVAQVKATSHPGGMALMAVTIQQPAQAPAPRRSQYNFHYLTNPRGNL